MNDTKGTGMGHVMDGVDASEYLKDGSGLPWPHAQLVVYVAGRFRGADSWEMECNIREAELVAWSLFTRGFCPITPHTQTRFFQGSLPDSLWIRVTLTMMHRCDAVLVLPGWETSEGTRGEIDQARRVGIPVVFLGALDLAGIEAASEALSALPLRLVG